MYGVVVETFRKIDWEKYGEKFSRELSIRLLGQKIHHHPSSEKIEKKSLEGWKSYKAKTKSICKMSKNTITQSKGDIAPTSSKNYYETLSGDADEEVTTPSQSAMSKKDRKKLKKL